MEISDVVILVVAAAAMLIKFVASLNESKGQNTGGEVFPQMEPLVPVVEEVKSRKDKKAAEPVNPAPKQSHTPLRGSDMHEHAEPVKKNRFAIKGKSEAKRAIIYAEIFNRKFN